jgi:hypothetical protein
VTPAIGERAFDPNEPSKLVLLCVGRFPSNGCPNICAGTCYEHAAGAAVEHGADDLGHLLGQLAIGQDYLGSALPQLAMEVDAREPEVAKRQPGKLTQRLGRLELATSDTFEKRQSFISQARHDGE